MIVRELLNVINFKVDSKGLNDAENKMDKFKTGMGNFAKGAGIVAGVLTGLAVGIFKFTEGIVNAGDEIAKTARDIGMSGESLQEWRFNADMAGISSEELSMSMKFFTKNLTDASNTGKGAVAESFKILGLSLKDAQGNLKDNNTLLLEMGDKFKNIQDPALKAKLATDMFGKSGIRMSSMLGQGSEELKKFAKEAHDLGLVMSENMLNSAENLNDNIARMKASFQGLGIIMGNALIPIVDTFVNGITETLKAVQRDLIQIVGSLTESIKPVLNMILGLIKPVFQLLTPIMKIVSILIGSVSRILGQTLIPFIGTLAEILLPILDQLSNTIESLMVMLEPMLKFVINYLMVIIKQNLYPLLLLLQLTLAILKPIFDLLSILFVPFYTMMNDVMLYLNIVIDMLMKIFQDLIPKVVDSIVGFFAYLKDGTIGIFTGVIDTITNTFNDIIKVIANFVTPIYNAFSFLFDPIINIFTSIIDKIKEGFGNVVGFIIGIVNGLIEKVNSLPFIKDKIKLVQAFKMEADDEFKKRKQMEDQKKLTSETLVNNANKINNLAVNNKITMNGSSDSKSDINRVAGTVFNMELKKLLMESGGL